MNQKLETWFKERPDLGNMIWRGAAAQQFSFLQDIVVPLMRGHDECAEARVVSTHKSKSIELPVVEIGMPILGLRVFARDNFHNVAFTVQSENPVTELDTSHLRFDGLDSCYFEGFERGHIPIYGPYEKDNRRFSAHSGVEIDTILNRLITALSK